jgi:hypothetical protein
MLNNWETAKEERKKELAGIYYAKTVEDKDVETLVRKIDVNVR